MTDPDDLDAIVTELNAGASPPLSDQHTARLRAWLEQVVAQSGSDLLLVAGAAPSIRIAGAVVPLAEGPLGGEEIADAVLTALPPHPRKAFLEIGIDAPDFPTALRAALRQAPDVIVVGEMRDPETMQMALAAGETGHLVFSSLHTTDAASTVARIADSFPLERQNTVRQELSMALAAVLTQTLMPKIGGGLIPAAELLMIGYGARQHVRKNALQHLHQEITITRRQGSFTLEESLTELVKQGLVDHKDALTRAVHPEELERLLG